ncbi:MAG: AarF/ABC1/UbiB kinase family protein [Dehalococcoidales bacterium]|nr:AarF/ABC1/UbiB kinase family protein [Dehalococcoidales bacterium]
MVLNKHQLKDVISVLNMERFLPFVPNFSPWRKSPYSQPERARMAIEELGTTFIKVGQILSTRTDILPSDFTNELSKLQNSLTPIPSSEIEAVIKQELGHPVNELFKEFDPHPLGVASIGQAHAATLLNGAEVVVKVQKPGTILQVSEDLEILQQLADRAKLRASYSGEYDLSRIVQELAETLNDEMDYAREGRSAEHFADFFRDDPQVHIPKVYWEYSTDQVITLERIKGINLRDVPALEKAGIDRVDLAKRCVNLWLRMLFEDEVFHADPHPGNLFVEPNGNIGLVDFGMVGFIDDEVRNKLAGIAKSIVDRNVDLLVESLTDLGAVSRGNTGNDLRTDLKHLMGHYPPTMLRIRLSTNLTELFNVVRRNHVQLPDNTFLLLKTVAMTQSLGFGIDPNLDFFQLVMPHVEKINKEKYSFSAIIRRIPSALADMGLLGVGLPKRIFRIFRSVEQGELNIRTDVSGLERHLEHLERLVNRLVIGMIAAALILGLAILFLGIHLKTGI